MSKPPRLSTGAQLSGEDRASAVRPGVGDAGGRILLRATELFARYGYHGVSTRAVASAARVNQVTVYRHYPRKRDLYVAVIESELQQLRLGGEVLTRMAEAADGRIAVQCAFELIVETLKERPEIVRLLQFSALEWNEDIDPLVRRHLSELLEVLARYVEPWMQTGELGGSSAKAVILTLVGIVISQHALQRLFSGKEASPGRLFEAYAGISYVLAPGMGGAVQGKGESEVASR
jgi:AcrR family transcriptional regulator